MKQATFYMCFLMILSLLLAGCAADVPIDTTPQDVVTDETPAEVIVPASVLPDVIAATYHGKILAGNKTPYIEFNTQDYEKAKSSGKVILLYFYSDVGILSQSEEYKVLGAFNDMANFRMIGFKVHFDDSVVTDAERQLASTLEVKEARTKVILKNGEVVQKSSTSWDKSTYAAQMSIYLD